MEDTMSSVQSPRKFSFDLAAAWALTVTSVLSVVVAIPVAWVPFLHTKNFVLAIGGLITLVLFLLSRLTSGSLALPRLPLLGAIWLVPLAYLLSTFLSGTNPETAFFGNGFSADTFGIVLILSVLATLASFILADDRSQRIYFRGLGVGFGLILLSEIAFLAMSMLWPATFAPTANLVGSFVDLAYLAGLMIILALMTLRFLRPAGTMRTAVSIGLVLGLGVLAIVNSALTWILVAIVAFGLFVEAVMYRKAHEPRPLISPLLVLVFSALFILGGSTIGSGLTTALGTNVVDARPSAQATFMVGSHTYTSEPIFGSGPGTFGEEWLKHRDRSVNETIFWNLDFNAGVGRIPTSFVTTGVVGALAWIAFLALFLVFGVKYLLLRLPASAWQRFAATASFIGSLYVLTLAATALPGSVMLGLGYVLIGLFVAALSEGRSKAVVFSENPRIGFALVFVFTLLILASIAAVYVVVVRYAADLAYTQATTAVAAGDVNATEKAIAQSIALAPTDRAYRVASLVSLTRVNQVIQDTTLSQATAQEQLQTAVSNALAAATQATIITPTSYENWAVLGNVYASLVPLRVEGAYDKAKESYDKAIALAPTNPALALISARLEIANNNRAGAEARLIEAITLKRDYTEAILLFSSIEVASGKTAEALQAAEAAAYFAPNDPGVLLQVGLLRSAANDLPGAIQALSRAVELNPQFANARFFLGVMYALSGDYPKAATAIEAVAAFSPENATAVEADLAALKAGKNPFPASRLAAFGIPYAPVDEPTPPGVTQGQ